MLSQQEFIMTRNVTIAATQFACSWDLSANLEKAEALIRRAASEGAQIILIQELFKAPYFCIDQHPDHRVLAETLEECELIKRFQALARELDVVLPCSFFERHNNAFYNSMAMVDAGGEVLGVYRKTHIPNGPAYQEKHFFTPGDTGFKVWKTKYAKIGLGICWDQWFPEAARCMALMGAEILLYPTAIGSEPDFRQQDSQPHWTMTQRGHAAANIMPVIASNRIGTEKSKYIPDYEMTFYGSSFITDQFGELVAQADKTSECIITHTFDLEAINHIRDQWVVFRDRRPEMYTAILTSDGETIHHAVRF
jgi:N-carbamoylputrescine amidase